MNFPLAGQAVDKVFSFSSWTVQRWSFHYHCTHQWWCDRDLDKNQNLNWFKQGKYLILFYLISSIVKIKNDTMGCLTLSTLTHFTRWNDMDCNLLVILSGNIILKAVFFPHVAFPIFLVKCKSRTVQIGIAKGGTV